MTFLQVRILGEGDFVEQVLARAEEKFTRQHELKSKGYDLEKTEQRACGLCGISPEELRMKGRERKRVEARSLSIYWAVSELGLSGMLLAKRYQLTQPAIVYSFRRGQKIAKNKDYQIIA